MDRNLIFNAKQTISPPWQKVSSTLGLPRNIQNAIFKTVTMTNKTEKAFSPKGCAMKWENDNFITSGWLPANCLPSACQLPADWLPKANWWLSDNCLKFVWQHERVKTTSHLQNSLNWRQKTIRWQTEITWLWGCLQLRIPSLKRFP